MFYNSIRMVITSVERMYVKTVEVLEGHDNLLVIVEGTLFTLWSLHDFMCILIVINYARSDHPCHWCPHTELSKA